MSEVHIVAVDAAAVEWGGPAARAAVASLADLATMSHHRIGLVPECEAIRCDPREVIVVTDDPVDADRARNRDAIVAFVDGGDLAWSGVREAVRHLLDPDDTDEATFLASLRASGQLADTPAAERSSGLGVTHQTSPRTKQGGPRSTATASALSDPTSDPTPSERTRRIGARRPGRRGTSDSAPEAGPIPTVRP